jgi:hypothetical protein
MDENGPRIQRGPFCVRSGAHLPGRPEVCERGPPRSYRSGRLALSGAPLEAIQPASGPHRAKESNPARLVLEACLHPVRAIGTPGAVTDTFRQRPYGLAPEVPRGTPTIAALPLYRPATFLLLVVRV